MKTFKYQLIKDSRLFEICRDIAGDDEMYSVFKVMLDGSHYEYLYKNNSTGVYTSTPNSLLTPGEISEMSEKIEENLV